MAVSKVEGVSEHSKAGREDPTEPLTGLATHRVNSVAMELPMSFQNPEEPAP